MPKIMPRDTSKRKSTEEELQRRIRKEFNIPEDEYGNAILYAISSFVNEGYGEANPIFEKHRDLFCEWDGHLHSDPECDEKVKRELKQQED